MKLLMVTHYFESHRSGIELIAGRFVRELTRLGQEVTWIACDATPPPPDHETGGRAVAVHALNFTEQRFGIPFPIPGPPALHQLRREIRRADTVLLQDCLYPLCIAAFGLARMVRKPVVITQHVGLVPYNNPLLRQTMAAANALVARRMLGGADRVAFVSEITEAYFSQVRFRAPPELLFNGVDTGVFYPRAAGARDKPRERLGLPSDRPVILFVGRFVEKKGIHFLQHTARLRPDLLWAFAGWGPLDPARWGMANVRVFTGLAGATLAELYRASDLLVLPSKGEGFPLVIQEALACGLPVVCSPETALADAAIVPWLTTAPLDDDDPEATARALCGAVDAALADAGDEAARTARAGFAARRYSWPATAARYLELIRSAARE